jgi:hypothetical protein
MEIAGIFHEINQAFYGYPQLMETHQYDFMAFMVMTWGWLMKVALPHY